MSTALTNHWSPSHPFLRSIVNRNWGTGSERPVTCQGPCLCYWEGRVWGSSSHLSLHPVITLYSGAQLLLLRINCWDLLQFSEKGTVTSHNAVNMAAARS